MHSSFHIIHSSFHSPIRLCIHPSISFIHPSTHPFFYAFILLYNSFILPLIYSSMHSSFHIIHSSSQQSPSPPPPIFYVYFHSYIILIMFNDNLIFVKAVKDSRGKSKSAHDLAADPTLAQDIDTEIVSFSLIYFFSFFLQ